jgi:hypothetical protein
MNEYRARFSPPSTDSTHARKRQAPLEKARSKYPEMLVEVIVAAELFKLLRSAAAGNVPEAPEIEQSLINMEDEIRKIGRPSR